MSFPRIESLGDVEPHVSFDKGFVISRRRDHTVVDYVYVVDDTFNTPISMECRGLKFDRDGRIIGRPFHKFFNLGERQRIEDVDWSAQHRVQAKLDGSMVHPVLLDGDLVFMTRMGATEQAARARRHADAGALDLCRHLVESGLTPMFEFTAPENRIVVAYDLPQLTLLAARDMITGSYLSYDEIARLGQRFAVAVVDDHGQIDDINDFVKRARAEAGIEGYVLAFDDGHRLKLKTDGYVLRHKALAGVALEKNVLAWVCADAIDDVVPLLPDHIASSVLAYRSQVHHAVAEIANGIRSFAREHADLPRKDFAAMTFARFDRRLTNAVFAALDGKDVRQALINILSLAAHSETKVDAVRDLFGMSWSVGDLQLPDLEA